ncbi:hypothetical protein PoB_005257200 [Plakobranchus ocellatus]|uniref:Uncharacterized protein n=1 Tax=Plakobranchus ocellatus TaxID=259542 RepID=A0AAV4C380_9GAST|nr:hypothetical protein PoB_005257200 [Plakobranchus ocellatus]
MSGESVRYLRPLDRSQDKNFEKLAQRNQVSVTALRTAMEKAKSRMALLRDSNGLKDEMIEEEKILRKAAEDRLDKFLVDLYANPDVNSELRQRLPYANKKDPFAKVKETDLDELQEPCVNAEKATGTSLPPSLHEPHNHERFDVVTNSSTQGLISSSEGSIQSIGLSRLQSDNPVNKIEQDLCSSYPAYSQSFSSNAHTVSSWMGSAFKGPGTGPLPAASTGSLLTVSTAAPYMLPMGPLSSSANSVTSFAALPQQKIHKQPPAVSLNPLTSASFGSLAASYYIELPHPHDFRVPDESFGQNSASSHFHSALSSGSMAEQGITSSASFFAHTEPSLVEANVCPLYMSPLPSQASSLYIHRMATDNVSHISRLLAEIATLKKENQELKDKLKKSEQKCEELRLGIGSCEEKKDDDIGDSEDSYVTKGNRHVQGVEFDENNSDWSEIESPTSTLGLDLDLGLS